MRGGAGQHQRFLAILTPAGYRGVAKTGVGLYSTAGRWLLSAKKSDVYNKG